MVLRKVNSVFSLLATFLLMGHSISHTLWMLSRGSIEKKGNHLGGVLLAVMMLHGILSILLAVRGHKGAEKKKCNGYPRLNAQTIFQRAGGVLLILFTILHVLGTVGVMQPPPLVHAIIPPLFFAVALSHAAVSLGKAFITLGIGNAKLFKVVDVFAKLLCITVYVAAVIGFYLFKV